MTNLTFFIYGQMASIWHFAKEPSEISILRSRWNLHAPGTISTDDGPLSAISLEPEPEALPTGLQKPLVHLNSLLEM